MYKRQTLDIRLSSRALQDDEKSAVDGTVVALDGIAIVVNKDSKVCLLYTSVSLCKPVKYSSQGFTFFTTR